MYMQTYFPNLKTPILNESKIFDSLSNVK